MAAHPPSSSASSQTATEAASPEADVEAQKVPTQKKAAHWELVFDQTHVTPEVLNWPYKGSGTEDDPYVVEYIENDRRNPMLLPKWKKWTITLLVAFATLAVAFVSSAYSGGIEEILATFHVSTIVAALGISLFVLGFAIGPLLWAPLSELYGRQVLFIGTYAALTAFNAGAAGAKNIETLVILRFFAGAFGSSPLTNAGGVIADMFPASERGMAMSIFAAAPFLGPVIGPIVGGFLGETKGWRWVEGLMAIFTGALWIIGSLTIPETYTPVILRRRAAKLSKMTGKVYKSAPEIKHGTKTIGQEFKTALSRPWILLFREPIVLLLSIYMAIIYGTLYMMFGAFPIVFQQQRGWSPGIGGLSFIGVAVGMILAVCYSVFDNKRYVKVEAKHNNNAPPEARLPPALIGSIALPVGLFWFAWTNYPSIHWSVSIIGTAPFGFGMVLVFLSIMNYLIDSYVIYAASVLAANSVLRSLFGAVFPLFTPYMYQNLGIHWASTVPAALAVICVPFPFLFFKYGKGIRLKCKYAAEAAAFLEQMKGGGQGTSDQKRKSEQEEEREDLTRDEVREEEKKKKKKNGEDGMADRSAAKNEQQDVDLEKAELRKS